jgi:hypothetical protein
MKGFSMGLCLIGVLVTALGAIAFYDDQRGLGVAGFVFGVGVGATGVMVFLTEFTLQIFRRTASLMVRFKFMCLRLEVHGELGTPVDELRGVGDTVMEPLAAGWPD